MRVFLALMFFTATSMAAKAQSVVNWLSWEEALELNKKEKKKILVDVYTNWCRYCKQMEKTTLSDPYIVQYVNENYYPIKFNAEQKEEIVFNGKTYKYVGSFSRRGYHELAYEIMKGKMSYPTVVFINENLEVIQPVAGFLQKEKFEMIMTFFAENYYKAVPWKKFEHAYRTGKTKTRPLTPQDIQPEVQSVGNGKQ